MTKLTMDLPLFQLSIECSNCKSKSLVDRRAWDINYWWSMYDFCPSCSPTQKRFFEILDAKLVNSNVPLLQGEEDPNEAKNYAIKVIKTGGWIGQGYHVNKSYSGHPKYGDLLNFPHATNLSSARVFNGIRSVKSTISRFVNRSGGSLQRNDFKVFEIKAVPTQEIAL